MSGLSNNSKSTRLQVLTFAMTIEYNGFEYAGFQRQTATHIDTSSCNQQHQNKKAKKSKRSSSTIQHNIEVALQQYTNLSIAILRVRGAGRTDKGVHATGQVVAFDIPIKLLNIDDYCICHEDVNKEGCDINNEKLSEHCIKHIQDAYHILNKHMPTRATSTTDNDKKNTATFIDLWQIRRALSTRLPNDIIIRSIRLYTDIYNPFEPRKRIQCKTYVYKLRFRCLSYLNDDESAKQSSCPSGNIQQQQQLESSDTKDQAKLHPICNSGPHLLRRINDQNTVWLSQWPLNPSLLHQASNLFVGKHDFVNFVHKDERKKIESIDADDTTSNVAEDTSDHVIDLFEFSIDIQSEEEEDKSLPPVMNATFTLKAKGFHRSMVRLLVGFMVDVARGKQSLKDIPILLLDKKEEDVMVTSPTAETLASLKVHAAPACGLSLANVEYEHDNFL